MHLIRALPLDATLLAAGCLTPMTGALEDLAAVDALLERQQDAWNAGDVEAFMAAGYWESDKLTFLSGGDWTWGYDAVLRRYRERYLSDGAEMGTLAFADVQIVALGPDSALARGRYHLDFTTGKTTDGLFSLVLRRLDDGRWRIVHDHTSSADERWARTGWSGETPNRDEVRPGTARYSRPALESSPRPRVLLALERRPEGRVRPAGPPRGGHAPSH